MRVSPWPTIVRLLLPALKFFYRNPFGLAIFTILYFACGLAISYLWHVHWFFKVICIIVLMIFAPDIEDMKEVWGRRKEKPE
jgi:hypothetical protein